MFLYQPTNGYCYNSDSIFLYDFIAAIRPKGKVLDVGCGVGIISLLLSRDFAVDMTIIDIQEKMLLYAKHNFQINDLEVEAILGDFVSFRSKSSFDLIISNPPFYDSQVTQSENSHINIARYAQHLPFEQFVQNVKSLLKPRGRFIFCYDAKQIDQIMVILKQHKLNIEVIRFVHSKIERESKLVMILARKGSKSMTKVLAPLIVFDEESKYRTEAMQAFVRADTHSIKGDFEEIEWK